MAASFPGAIKNFSAIVNGVTKLVAALFNSPYDEITAIETELGTSPKGSYADVKARLDATTTLGAWVDKSSSYGAQQATTDGFVIAYGTGSGSIYGYTDVNADPTTVRQRDNDDTAQSIMFPVKKNDYWKVTTAGPALAVYWIPLGA